MKYYPKTENPLIFTTGPRVSSMDGDEEAGNPNIHDSKPQPAGSVIGIRREIKGRNGKTVTTVSGLPLAGAKLSFLASELKRTCGTGGTVKDGIIIIQGDHRPKIKSWLESQGYRVKLTGG